MRNNTNLMLFIRTLIERRSKYLDISTQNGKVMFQNEIFITIRSALFHNKNSKLVNILLDFTISEKFINIP